MNEITAIELLRRYDVMSDLPEWPELLPAWEDEVTQFLLGTPSRVDLFALVSIRCDCGRRLILREGQSTLCECGLLAEIPVTC